MNTQCHDSRRRWFGLAVLAAVLTCVGLMMSSSGPNHAQGQDGKDPAKKDGDKKDAKKPAGAFPDIEEFLKKLPPQVPQEQVDRIRKSLEQAKARAEEGQKRVDEARKRAEAIQRVQDRFNPAKPNRLGARFEKPDATLTAQLGLVEGKGLVMTEVPDGSVANKAGFKTSDILLKLDGKDVSSDVAQFTTALNDVKADAPIDAVVLRRGKEETIKGLKLPEPAAKGKVRRVPPN
jgi:C-terminal processing protease CtpA/Prc